LEKLARRLISDGSEGPKLDFKLELHVDTVQQKVELAKDVSAIANTDDPWHFSNYGYIIIGAKPGKLVGGIDALSDEDADNFSARLTQTIAAYIAPPPSFHVVGFNDPQVGLWGVVVIPPSGLQPHIFVKELSGNPAKHEWFVRIGETTERAGPADYARILSTAAARALAPLEREYQRLSLRLDALERRPESRDSPASLQGLRAAAPIDDSTLARPDAALHERARAMLSDPLDRFVDELLGEALRVAKVMEDDHEELPWHFTQTTPDKVRAGLAFLEDATRPLAEALASAIRYDRKGRLDDGIAQAMLILAREPEPKGGVFSTYMPRLRLYPLILCLYTIVLVSATRGRAGAVRNVLALPFEFERGRIVVPMPKALEIFRGAHEYFNVAEERELAEPIAKHLLDVIPIWCAPYVIGQSARSEFYVAEFLLGLAYLDAALEGARQVVPFPGVYLYAGEAHRPIDRVLRARPKWFEEMFQHGVETLLAAFDEHARDFLNPMYMEAGFFKGAADAWAARGPKKA
jgi:hypothetical protein